MARIDFDEARSPLIVIRYPKQFTQDEWVEHVAEMTALLTRLPRFGLISDTVGSPPPDPARRKLIVDSFIKHEAIWRERCLAAAVVVNSQLIRGAVTALQWLKPPPFPWKVVTSMNDAERWVNSHLHAEPQR